MNREIDFEYKYELQKKLFEIFDKAYFTEKEIKEKLETTTIEVRRIVKRLPLRSEGYERVDIVVRLMGGRLYAK